jgi:hypothetical protein
MQYLNGSDVGTRLPTVAAETQPIRQLIKAREIGSQRFVGNSACLWEAEAVPPICQNGLWQEPVEVRSERYREIYRQLSVHSRSTGQQMIGSKVPFALYAIPLG